jgi:hypothetical protein
MTNICGAPHHFNIQGEIEASHQVFFDSDLAQGRHQHLRERSLDDLPWTELATQISGAIVAGIHSSDRF